MTGPEHYREAERLRAAYKDAITDVEALPAITETQRSARLEASIHAGGILHAAQVHATLALAAATAFLPADPYLLDESARADWAAVVL